MVAIDPDADYAHIDSLSLVYEGRRYAYSTPEEAPRFKVRSSRCGPAPSISPRPLG